MVYRTKEFEMEVVKYTDVASANEIVAKANGQYFIQDSRLYKKSDGLAVPPETFVCFFPTGEIKLFTSTVFNSLFEKKAPPMYKLSDIPEIETRKIRRLSMSNDTYISWAGIAWKMTCGDMSAIFEMTPEDIAATDWVVVG